jgi:hypothetical protein
MNSLNRDRDRGIYSYINLLNRDRVIYTYIDAVTTEIYTIYAYIETVNRKRAKGLKRVFFRSTRPDHRSVI